MTKLQQMTTKQPVNRTNFSSPLYSEAIIHHDVIYCSGKIGLDPATGQLVGDDVAEQTVSMSAQHTNPLPPDVTTSVLTIFMI